MAEEVQPGKKVSSTSRREYTRSGKYIGVFKGRKKDGGNLSTTAMNNSVPYVINETK